MANRLDYLDSADFIITDEIDELFGSANPNPDRHGCLSKEVRLSLSRRERPIDDPAYEHLATCSPCYREFRALQAASDSLGDGTRPRRAMWIAAIAATLVLVAGSAWLYHRTHVAVPQQNVLVAEGRIELDLRPFTVSRSPQDPVTRPPLDLPRGRLALTLLLPAGSEPGVYDIKLLDAALQTHASAPAVAEIRNFVTTLETRLDLQSMTAGPYQLAVRRSGEDWRLFPVTVR